jgi:hypothetical protein
MKKYLVFIIFCLPLSLLAQSWEWVKRAGGNQSDNAFASCTDYAGNIYATLNLGYSEAKILKFDISGNLIWESLLWHGKIKDIAYDETGYLYAIGDSTYYTPMLAKCDLNGNLVLKTTLDTGVMNSITSDNQGNVFMTGENQLLKKVDDNGNEIWNKIVPNAIGRSICRDIFNNIYVTGSIFDTAFFDANILVSQGNYDIFLAKFDENGNHIWAKRAGGTYIGNSLTNDGGIAVATDSFGNVYVTGSMVGTAYFDSLVFNASQNDMFLAKYDSNGNVVWVKQASNGSDMEGRCIVIDQQNNILVGGSYVPNANFDGYDLAGWGNYDAFIARYDSNGNFISVTNAGGNLWNEFVYDISIDSIGNTFAVGSYAQGAYFGNDTLLNLGLYDSFIAKVNLTTETKETNQNAFNIRVYPNPSYGVIAFDGVNYNEIKEIEINNLAGSKQLFIDKINCSIINIEQLKPGFYLLKMTQHNGSETYFKIICN